MFSEIPTLNALFCSWSKRPCFLPSCNKASVFSRHSLLSHAEHLTIQACMSQLVNSEDENGGWRLIVLMSEEASFCVLCRNSCFSNVRAKQSEEDFIKPSSFLKKLRPNEKIPKLSVMMPRIVQTLKEKYNYIQVFYHYCNRGFKVYLPVTSFCNSLHYIITINSCF